MNSQKKMKVLSLFSGCGGMDIGFEGGFTCLKKSVNTNLHPHWISKDNGDWVAARLTVSPDRIHGRRLETQQTKGGIPRMTPPNLTAWLLSLPPILYMIYRISVLSCSKAPWGLSV